MREVTLLKYGVQERAPAGGAFQLFDRTNIITVVKLLRPRGPTSSTV